MTAREPGPRAAAEPPSATLRWAVRLLWLEAAGLIALTAYLIVQDGTGRAADPVVAVVLTVVAALAAVVVALLGRALARSAGGARGPTVVVQLMSVVLGYSLIRGGALALGVPLLLLGLVTGVLMVLPSTTRALGLVER